MWNFCSMREKDIAIQADVLYTQSRYSYSASVQREHVTPTFAGITRPDIQGDGNETV